MLETLKGLNAILTPRDRAMLVPLTGLMLLSGTLDLAGLGLLFPYIAILQNPDRINAVWVTRSIYESVGFRSPASFAIAMSCALLLVFVVKAVLSIWINHIQIRFTYSKQTRLGKWLLNQYLSQRYAFFLSANVSTLIANVTKSVSEVCVGSLQAVLALVAEALTLLWILGLLLYINPLFTLTAIAFVGTLSLLYVGFMRGRIVGYGRQADLHWKAMLRSANEGLSAAKEIQVLGRSGYFVDRYGTEGEACSDVMGRQAILGQVPRAMLETGAVAGVVVFAVLALVSGQPGKDLFPTLAVFAVAAMRVIPSANRMLQAYNGLTFYRPAIEVVRAMTTGVPEPEMPARQTNGTPPVHLQSNLAIKIESFAYPGNPHFSLRDTDVLIRRGQTVAFIGPSGSGKTTIVDIVLGLFPDFDGDVRVDGVSIHDRLDSWRRSVGYIPQTIYLRDDTIARNIAFGIPDEQIDATRVQRAIRLAGLEPVVRSQAAGVDTVIGDRGIRLSGGERQRIGIARALYSDPDVLILDEATSALDNETERQIVDFILGLSPAKTIIVIAHRLSTVQHCDVVHLMREGRIVDRGTFAEVAARNPKFVTGVEATPAGVG